MVKRDFTRLTEDEKINGIKASKLPDHIRSKYHAGDVREAMAQSTELSIQLGINMGLSPDDALSWARKLQAAVPRSEFDSWVATLLDGGPSIFMNTLAELKAAYPKGAAGVALVRETDPAKIYVWNGSAWEDFGDYQGIEVKDGTITSNKIADGAIRIEDTDFATRGGKNLFDGNYLTGYAVLGGAVGTLTKTDDGAFTVVVPVDPGESYAIVKEGGNRFRVYTSEEDPLTYSGTLNNLYLYDDGSNIKVSIPQGHHYLIAYVSTGGVEPNRLQIEKGGSFTGWEKPNKVILNYADETIPNLALEPRFGFLNGFSEAVVIDYQNRNVIVGAGAYVQIGEKRLIIPEQTIDISGNFNSALTIHPETLEMFSYNNTLLVEEKLGLEKVILGYIDTKNRKSFLFGNYLEEKGSQKVEEDDGRSITLVGDIPADLFDVEAKTFNPKANRNISTLYGIYDKLVDDYPHLVSRQLLSNEESGLPIYRYDVKPVNSVNGQDYPKIIMTVTHGHEVQAAYGTAFAVDELVRRSDTDLFSRSIINNVHLIIIPMPNPYGFNRGERPNYNGVDLARNYTAGWVENESPDPGYGTHGSGPLSEIATQAIDQILRDNRDALFVLDIHNYGGDPYSNTVAPLTWESSTNKWVETHISDKHIKLMGSKVRFEGYGLSKDVQLGRVNPTSEESTWQGQLVHQMAYYDMDGMIIESMNTFNGSTDDNLILKYNTETVGNVLATILRVYGN